ncbi:MAG: ribokinase [Gemmataceae bacterium]
MGTSPRICVIGSVNVDLTFRASRLPRPGETIAGERLLIGGGGKGANQAVAAARLGAKVSLVAQVGADVFGQDSRRRFQAEGLDIAHVGAHPSLPTGAAAILVDAMAQNSIVVSPGANAGLLPEHVRAAAAVIEGADAVLCQLEVPLATTLEAFRIARGAGVRTILTPAPAVALPEELYHLTEILIPNETEAETLTGGKIGGFEEAKTAAHELRRRGAAVVVLTMGARGALVVEAASVVHVPARKVEAVDTTGAGDAFAAALAVFAAEGQSLRQAAESAALVAAIAVSRTGAQTAFPTRAELGPASSVPR